MDTNSKAAVQQWLLGYAWAEETPEQKAAVVDCIMAQDDWRLIDARADQFAGAQAEPGPAAFDEGQQFALSGLYECHTGPHKSTCPLYKWECDHPGVFARGPVPGTEHCNTCNTDVPREKL